MFSIVAVLMHIPTNCVGVFPFLTVMYFQIHLVMFLKCLLAKVCLSLLENLPCCCKQGACQFEAKEVDRFHK